MFLAHGLAQILWKPSGFLSLIYSTVVEKSKILKKKADELSEKYLFEFWKKIV